MRPCSSAAQRLRAEQPEQVVEVDVQPETPEVLADWHRLGQVIDNLLENADHAAPKGTPIRMSAWRDETENVVVSITDSGPGVPKEMRTQIFERFVRGEQSSYPGIGLGLPIVKGLIEAQGGRIWVGTSDSGGASFCFTIPAASSAE